MATDPMAHFIADMNESAVKVGARRPELAQVSKDIAEEYAKVAQQYAPKIKALYEEAQNSKLGVNGPKFQQALDQLHNEAGTQVRNQVGARYKSEGKEAEFVAAWEEMGKTFKKTTNPNLFQGAANQFYDEDKKGVQWGGIVGGLVGLLMGLQFAQTGSWMGMLMMAVMTISAAWGGNKLFGFAKEKWGEHKQKEQAKEPEKERARERTQEPAPDLEAVRKLAEKNREPGEFNPSQANIEDTGVLNGQFKNVANTDPSPKPVGPGF